jgi:hypothetical protein
MWWPRVQTQKRKEHDDQKFEHKFENAPNRSSKTQQTWWIKNITNTRKNTYHHCWHPPLWIVTTIAINHCPHWPHWTPTKNQSAHYSSSKNWTLEQEHHKHDDKELNTKAQPRTKQRVANKGQKSTYLERVGSLLCDETWKQELHFTFRTQ